MAKQKQGSVAAYNNAKSPKSAQRHAPTATADVAESVGDVAQTAHSAAQSARSGGTADAAVHTVPVGQCTHSLACTTLAALRESWQQAYVPSDAGKAEPLAGKASSAKPTACAQLVSESGHNRHQNAALWGGKGAGAGHLASWASGLARWLNARPHTLPKGYRAAVATGTVSVNNPETGNAEPAPAVHLALVSDADAS